MHRFPILAAVLLCVASCAGPAPEAAPRVAPAPATLAAGPAAAPAVLPDRVLLNQRFGEAGVAVNIGGKAEVTGTLPAPWRDDSGWADLEVAYSTREEDGIRFLTIRTGRITSGFAQLARLLPDDAGERIYRLSAQVRTTPGADVRIGIRQQASPWRMLGSCTPAAVGGWQRIEQDLAVSRVAGEAVGIWIQVHGVGSLDLAELTLSERDPAALDAERSARCGGVASPNLVRVSRFPLGLPSGWMLDRTISDGDVAVIGATAAGC